MKNTLHMIGNAHLDPVWLWRWTEGFQENKASIRSALERLLEFDDVLFTSSSAQFYVWLAENAPDLLEQVKTRVQQGRWAICGGWWVQPDCNMPCGESLARHSLYGQRFFHDTFGIIARTGYCVDSFGHTGMIPQILRKSGMDRYVFMRPGPHEMSLPSDTFRWESPDGSSVTAFRIHDSYCIYQRLEEAIDKGLERVRRDGRPSMVFYGVGNHGGGPTIACINTIHSRQAQEGAGSICFSTPDRFFDQLDEGAAAALPVVRGELQHHAVGCYTAVSAIKKWNRRAEHMLLRAEKLSSIVSVMNGTAYPTALTRAWKRVLFNQFHDILAGSSIEAAYEDARNELGEAMAIAQRTQNNALQAISFAVNIPQEPDMLPVFVFNPHPWAITATPEVETSFLGMGPLQVEAVNGEKLPCQRIQSETTTSFRQRIVFACAVPPMGYTVCRIRKSDDMPPVVPPPALPVLENDKVRVTLSPSSGNIASILDKTTGQEILGGEVRAEVLPDESDTWSHGVVTYETKGQGFVLERLDQREQGPVRQSIRVRQRYGHSTLTMTYTLYAHAREICLAAMINWQERHTVVKLRVPLHASECTATYETAFGYAVRETEGQEEPMQGWMDLSAQDIGLSILNDCKYGASVLHTTAGITLLRSPVYAHHEPQTLSSDMEYRYTDQGEQCVQLRLLPHDGDWRKANTVRAAWELNQPFVVEHESTHPGPLAQEASYLTVSAPNVVLSACKRAEDGDGIILRLFEAHGLAVEAYISCPPLSLEFTASFAPHEIKTLWIGDATGHPVRELNLLEWPATR